MNNEVRKEEIRELTSKPNLFFRIKSKFRKDPNMFDSNMFCSFAELKMTWNPESSFSDEVIQIIAENGSVIQEISTDFLFE